MFVNKKKGKSGVIDDPLSQPIVPASSDGRLILKFWDGRTDLLPKKESPIFMEFWIL